MPRFNGTVAFSSAHSSIEEISSYYQDSETALNTLYLVVCPETRFLGYSQPTLEEELKEKKDILDRTCSLELLAALEAKFRIDYLIRCRKN